MSLNIFTKGRLFYTILALCCSLAAVSQKGQLIQYTTTADQRQAFHKSIISSIHGPAVTASKLIW